MDLPNLGKHCQIFDKELNRICNQLDFCPFYCDSCNKWSCLNHRKHDCQIGGDSKKKEIIQNSQNFLQENQNFEICPHKNCQEKLGVFAIKCHKCNLKYCVKHRHHFDH